MLRQEQRRDLAVGRQDVANFYEQNFQDRIGWGLHLHLGQLRVDVGKLCPRLDDACLGCLHDFLLRPRRTNGLLRVGWRNYFSFEQFLLTLGVVTQKLQQGRLRFGIMRSAVDLCDGKIAARRQLSRVQFNNRLIGVQFVAFLREDLLHATAHARADMHFVYFDCSGNSVATIATARRQD